MTSRPWLQKAWSEIEKEEDAVWESVLLLGEVDVTLNGIHCTGKRCLGIRSKRANVECILVND